MIKKHFYILIGAVLLSCTTACITIYVQKDNTNSSITTSDTSQNSADSASVDINIPSDVLK